MTEDAGRGLGTGPGRIQVRVDGRTVSTVPLNKPVLLIGREPSTDLSLPDPRVSRHHAELRLEAAGPAITDLGSSNGTFIDGVRLLAHQPRMLKNGDVVLIGPFSLTYEESRQSQAEGPVPAEPARPAPREREVEAASTAIVPIVPPALPAPPRPQLPAPIAPGPVSRYLHNLPGIFQESGFLARYLLILQSIWEPLELRQDHIDMYFDARSAPAALLPWLCSWMGLEYHHHWPEARNRDRLAEAMDLYRWRGTPYGMARMIEVTTGLIPEILEDPGEPFVFRIRVAVPAGSDVDRDLLEGLIEAHKPAHAGYVLDMTA